MNLNTKHITHSKFLYEEYRAIILSRWLEVSSTARNTFVFRISNNFQCSVNAQCSLTDQLQLSFSRNGGPSNHIEFFKSFTSLDTMVAGFWRHETWSDDS